MSTYYEMCVTTVHVYSLNSTRNFFGTQLLVNRNCSIIFHL